MLTTTESDIQELMPYTNAQYRAALERVLRSPVLPGLVRNYFPHVRFEDFVHMAQSLQSVTDFQQRIISPAIDSMLKQGSGGITLSGIENLVAGRQYLFVSNHRDIICDPALLTQRLSVLGHGTPRICLGDNLLSTPLIIDLIKINKGVTVKRGLSPRELLRWSHALSELIYRSISRGEDSVWIAQREGRTKNGDDRTQPGILKMLTMAGEGSFLERISALHIVPVAISYEYDPCDHFKARELHLTESQGTYVKAPGEDQLSMIEGIRGAKGRIHLSIGRELDEELREAAALEMKKDQVESLARSIDRQIHSLYRCWPTNYIAADLLDGGAAFETHYTPEQKRFFAERMRERLKGMEPAVERHFLEAYAKPVRNARAHPFAFKEAVQ